jgi:prolyl oligopeptidase
VTALPVARRLGPILALGCTLALPMLISAQTSTPPQTAAPAQTPAAAPTPVPAQAPTPAQTGADAADPFLWLEQVHSERSMRWVRAENAKTLAVLEKDPRYPRLYADAVRIVEARDRIPMPSFIGGEIYNFWRDAHHVRGIWRRSSLADYRLPDPPWRTVLDVDALARAENANWFWHGADCQRPAERLCLVTLSSGSEDATTMREFDVSRQRFVPGGFALPRSKQTAAWMDPDRLLVARDWGAGTMTASGYPFVVKALRRGEPLSAAHEIFRGQRDDVEVDVTDIADGAGHQAVLIQRAISFFETEDYLLGPAGPLQLNLPLKTDVEDMVAGRLVIRLNQSWQAAGQNLPAGALVSIELADALADPQHLKPQLIYAPQPRESLGAAAATRSELMVTIYRDVKARAVVYTPLSAGGWSARALALPDNASINIVATDLRSEQAFLGISGFLLPSSLWLVDAAGSELAMVKQLPPRFDASDCVVEQWQATSRDGTRIPYFVVHRQAMPLDGKNPTILYAYGGFQVSETPAYSAIIGKLWLQRGGVYVVANIRGGGEFGPAWHEAGLKTNRQRIYDDFAAVAEDLLARKVTSVRRLGIQGGSNGGLLMGVEFTQHPELWNAVDIQVPLLDMLRFESIAAGSSWVGEYGSVSNPQERAFLAGISPYNNLNSGVRYPEPFIWTTTNDDRVGPQHARKFAAKLSSLGDPYLFYELIEGGHGAGAKLAEQARTSALEMTYFTEKLMD